MTEWRAVAVDHWVAEIAGCPVSIKRWPMGWILVRKASCQGRAGALCVRLADAVAVAVRDPSGARFR